MKGKNLAQLERGRRYLVTGFSETAAGYTEKLLKMGFVEGTPVRLAPVAMADPIVVEVRGGRIALRKNEARQVHVEELHDA